MSTVDCIIAHGEVPPEVVGSCPTLQLADHDPADWPSIAQPFLAQHVRYPTASCGVVMHGEITRAELALLANVEHHYGRAHTARATLQTFAKAWGRNFAATLKRAPAWATSLEEPLRGRPAFVVSAGPSLDRNGHLLPEAKRRGPVIAVNTAIGACLHHGVVPDLVVACEALNLSDHLAPLKGLRVPVIIDATASPANWDVAEQAWAISSCEPNTIPYTMRCGAVPIPYTGSVACAATSLALFWGASPVVLVGQDCAYTDGRYYATGTPYADLTVAIDDGLVHVSGRSKEQEPASVAWMDRWGDDTGKDPVASDYGMAVFVDWFERQADRHYLINATEGGARIENAYEQRLERVLRDLPIRDDKPVLDPQPVDTSSIVAELRREAEAVIACDDPWRGVPATFPLLNMWTTEAGFDRSGGPLARAQRRLEMMHEGAMEILEVLS